MEPVVLFRVDRSSECECSVAAEFFSVLNDRDFIPPESLVIARYSCLPFYEALESELLTSGSRLLNSFRQHRWIANFDYYEQLRDFTFETWDDANFASCDCDGPFVVKGRTNSKKLQWIELMFARDRTDALHLAQRLRSDPALTDQGILYRRFVPLRSMGTVEHGAPHSNEWRFFFLNRSLIGYGYYWSASAQAAEADISEEGIEFAHAVADVAAEHVNFFVVDIAEKADGGWILVELNDAQTSGLSLCDPREFYSKLKTLLASPNLI